MADPLTNDLVEIALRLRDIRQLTFSRSWSDRQNAALDAIEREFDLLMVTAGRRNATVTVLANP